MHELSSEQTRALLVAGSVAHVAVVSDGEPYVTPVSYVLAGDDLYFQTGPGRRLDAVAAGSRVCVEVSRTVESPARWESVIAWGPAEIVTDPDVGTDIAAKLLEKYRTRITSPLAFTWVPPGSADSAATVQVRLDTVTGRASSGGFGPEQRPARS